VRILQISSAKTFGGGERHFVDLCRELGARGHEVFVALRPTCEWRDRLSFIPPENFQLVSIRNSFGMFSAKRIARFIEANEIDLVHAHVARDYLAASVAVRMAKRGRLVLTRHVMFPMKPFHRFALKNVDAAIAVSPPVARQLENIFDKKKVYTIANGITFRDGASDPSALRGHFRSFHSIPPDAPLVVTLGELLPLKGQRDFVLAANEVKKRVPSTRFVIAGKDNSLDQSFRRELKRLVRVFGHEDDFLWLDWLDDIAPLMAAADLFVSPSHSESFGLAMLDAMSLGTPVIATATDGATHLITEKEALMPIKDPIAMADTICRYVTDESTRRRLAESQRRHALEHYGLETMVNATEELYKTLLNGKQ
jgi:glycosyltransferase involved in cell wall biosynthesis